VRVYVKISEETLERFLRIKEHLGLKNNTEVMRYIINEYYRTVVEKSPSIASFSRKA